VSITRDEVLKIAELANLEFAPEELDAFVAQFQRILDYVETLREVDVSGVEPTSHVWEAGEEGGRNLRDDLPRPSLGPEAALANAPDPGDGHFRVPKVL